MAYSFGNHEVEILFRADYAEYAEYVVVIKSKYIESY
jgi:hypothetical protein